jgi:hypothetical protein
MHIERRIITDLIVSTDYLNRIKPIWNAQFLEDSSAKIIAGWCWEYFEKYKLAPGKEIESIFTEKSKNLPKATAEEMEEDILPGLSEEYEREGIYNLQYSIDRTQQYFTERHLALHNESVQALMDEGKIEEAEKLIKSYVPLRTTTTIGLDLSDPIVFDIIKEAFNTTRQTVVRYPKQLGDFWNAQFVRGGFVAFMASEKRGKTFWLMDIALRSYNQKFKVAFFQAGDMTEEQQIKRIYTYLAQKNELKKYSGQMWIPVKDCVYNQLNKCDRKEREEFIGVYEFKDKDIKFLRDDVMQGELIAANTNPKNKDYKPCFNCEEYKHNRWGAVWTEQIDTGEPLTMDGALKAMEEGFVKAKRTFKLSSHANGTLTVQQIRDILNIWEQQENFVPDLVVIDYADLLVPETKTEFRHQQNEIWKSLRGLSQEKHCLVVTATQADAASYDQNRLRMKNFSEDKRKYSHVTAMYGLNQDTKDREKGLKLMRINEIVVREGDFSNSNEVIVLQTLERGRPFIGSMF